MKLMMKAAHFSGMPTRFPASSIRRPFGRPSTKLPWVCISCRLRPVLLRRAVHIAPENQQKPYYITSPIFYVNADPHIGHLYTWVLCDVLKRWHGLQGKEALFCTGADEHGMKVQRAAAKAGIPPKEFCDQGVETFKHLATAAHIDFTHFVRTSDPDHRETVQYAWYILKSKDLLYESKHEGWYSVTDETFYPESTVHLVVEPWSGRKMMASIETGSEVEWTSEINYRFRLSTFRDYLLKFYEENPGWIRPHDRMKQVVLAVTEGLEDISVSRSSERLNWGIPVPEDPSQTVYVWFDALLSYLTKLGYPWTPGDELKMGWPANMQVIGKDILRFHAIYWPAFLQALSLPPPSRILAHAHWTLNRQKMSKSVGNVVNPFFAVDRFGPEVLRFYLAHDGGLTDDADYSNYRVIDRHKKCLQGGLGNLASRIVRGKKWCVRHAVEWASSIVAEGAEKYAFENMSSSGPDLTDKHIHQASLIEQTPVAVSQEMEAGNVPAAVKTVMELVFEANKYITSVSPWDPNNSIPPHLPADTSSDESSSDDSSSLSEAGSNAPPPETLSEDSSTPTEVVSTTPPPDTPIPVRIMNDDVRNTTVYLCAESLRVSAILLQAVLPEHMSRLLDMLGVDDDKRSLEYASLGADAGYGTSRVPLGKGYDSVLFPPLDSDM